MENVFVFGKSGCIRVGCFNSGNMVVFGRKWLYSGRVDVVGQKWLYSTKWLYSGKQIVLGQSGCIREKVVIFGQKWLYPGENVFIRANCLYSGKIGFIRGKRFSFGKVVVFVKSG